MAKDVIERRPMDLGQARVPRGQVHVLPERCKECGYCVGFCPEDVLEFSADSNAKGYHYPVLAADKSDACVHCGFCSLICPELAIFTRELEPAVSGEDER